jgi:hypothetical protein
MHTRVTTCRGYRRDDGLWDMEGHMTDSKAYSFPNAFRDTIHAGEPLHEMHLRLTIDSDLYIHRAEAVLAAGPFEICPEIPVSFEALEGLRIGPGWSRAVRQRVGGVKGCTHLVDLVQALARVAIQTVLPLRARESQEAEDGGGKEQETAANAPRLNSCHAIDRSGQGD